MRDFRAGRLLGERQWRELEAFLGEADERDVPTLFFNASVPVVHVSPFLDDAMEWLPGDEGTDIRDRWCATPLEPEREALMNRLFAWQAARPERQVIFLSGDVHVGAAFRCRHPKGRGLIRQWTSSPLTTPTGLVDHLTNQIATALVNLGERCCRATREALVFDNNFGLVAVAPLPSGGHQVELTLYGYRRRGRDVRPAARVVARPSA